MAVIFASIRTGDFYGVNLIGESHISLGGMMQSGAEARLLLGYWLAGATVLILVFLAILRRFIIGKS